MFIWRKLFILLALVGITTASYAAFPPVNFTEEDGAPSTYPYKVKFTSGKVTDNADGTITVDLTGDAAASQTAQGSVTHVQYKAPGGLFGGDSGFFFDEDLDNVGIVGLMSSAQVRVTGTADEIQGLFTGNSTQTSDIFVVDKASGSDIVTITETGLSAFANVYANIVELSVVRSDTGTVTLAGIGGSNEESIILDFETESDTILVDTTSGATGLQVKLNTIKVSEDGIALKPACTYTVCASNARGKDACDYTCDGTADEVQINAAITALKNDKGTICLSQGTFTIAAPIVMDGGGQNLVGSGTDSTTVQLANGADCDGVQLAFPSQDEWGLIKAMTLSGNRANNASGRGIDTTHGTNNAHPRDIKIRDVFVTGWSEEGIVMKTGWGCLIDNVTVEYGDTDGIIIQSGADGKIVNSKIIENTGTGIVLSVNSSVTKIFNNNISGGDGKYAIYADGNRHTIFGNQIKDENSPSSFTGIYVVGDDIDIMNNEIYTENTMDIGIHLQSGADNNMTVGNSIETENYQIKDEGSANTHFNKLEDNKWVMTGQTVVVDSTYFGVGVENPSKAFEVYRDSPTNNEVIFRVGTSDDNQRLYVDEDGDGGVDVSWKIANLNIDNDSMDHAGSIDMNFDSNDNGTNEDFCVNWDGGGTGVCLEDDGDLLADKNVTATAIVEGTGVVARAALRIPYSDATPTTCNTGELYWDVDGDTDGSLYGCRAQNTWKEVDDDGGAGGGDITDVWGCSTGDCQALTAGASDSMDAGSASDFEIPNGAGPTVDAAGEIAVDTTDDQFVYYGAAKRVIPYKKMKSMFVENPDVNDSFTIWKTLDAITLTDVHCIVDPAESGSSAEMRIMECDATADNCGKNSEITCDNDGANQTSFPDASIDANDWLNLSVTAESGTVTGLTVTIYYTVDAE